MALIDNLVSYWALDEASGTRYDSHGSNDLTDNNTVGSATGKINSAADFEAADSDFLNDTIAYPSTNTISAWIKLESVGTKMWVAGFSDNGGAFSNILGVDTGGKAFAYAYDGTLNTVTGTTTLSTDTWYFLVGVFATGGTIKIYVNGTEENSASCGSLYTSLTHYSISKYVGSDYASFDGLIDESGLWDAAKSGSEITELYNSGAGLAYPFTGGAATNRRRRVLLCRRAA